MYTALLFILLLLSALLILRGVSERKRGRAATGLILALLTLLFFGLLRYWGEMLWFASLGYIQRFWIEIGYKIGLTTSGALFGFFMVYLLTSFIPERKRILRYSSSLVGVLLGGLWGFTNWEVVLLYLNGTTTAIKDPILKKNAGFYLFSLPLYDTLYILFLLLAGISFITSLAAFVRVRGEEVGFYYPEAGQQGSWKLYRSLYLNGAVLLFVLAWGKFLSRFHLLYSQLGAVTGPGWTDAHIRLPVYTILIFITGLLGIILLLPQARNRLIRYYEQKNVYQGNPHFSVFFTVGSFLIFAWLIGLVVIPRIFQWLVVEPNEITMEKQYINHNIRFTRQGFNLDKVEEREYPASEKFTREMVGRNSNTFSNIRLWDPRALDSVYKQFQEIRLYYEFAGVDIDRYTFGNTYRQVMVSAREMELSNLPEQSRTFVNKRFKYTHGYGITLTTVSEFTSNGLPNLLIKDIPPQTVFPELEVDQPRIYYGELTRTPVVVNSREKEFDYPSGEENVYFEYSGKGGVPISNLWRKFIFGWMFDGTRFFLSSYPISESRLLFHRQIHERVKTVAPFLYFDEDPYIVLAGGKLYWIIDGYTISNKYPYSEPFFSRERIEYQEGERTQTLSITVGKYLHGANYIRNSVKAVVDAFHGSVDFYLFEPNDPIINVWMKIFPGLIKGKNEMPEEILAHVRYPTDMLLVQGLVYAKYHMTDPMVFYNQEDLWIRATEKYYDRVQPVEPYYIMWKPPDSDKPEFVLILPFTPKKRQVLIGWIAGMCDPGNYGRLLAYKFPKEKRVLGPQQVETKIDQDRFLSGQLTLWDQRGSRVIRGNVLAIPIEDTLLYVEPVYLQAETAAYPELKLVVVMHEDELSYAETFDAALQGLFEKAPYVLPGRPEDKQASLKNLLQKANDAFENYISLLGKRKYQEAGKALQTLQETLRQLLTISSEKEEKERE